MINLLLAAALTPLPRCKMAAYAALPHSFQGYLHLLPRLSPQLCRPFSAGSVNRPMKIVDVYFLLL